MGLDTQRLGRCRATRISLIKDHMRNPWTTKNPFMSARGHATAAAKRQDAPAQAEAAKHVIELWSGKSAPRSTTKKRR